MTYIESLELNFREVLHLPEDAIEYLIALWDVIQFLDDVADRDGVSDEEFSKAVLAIFGGMPSNAFYQKHQNQLLPILMLSVMKWMAAGVVEKEGQASEKSYMWRAGYYDVIALVTIFVHGPNHDYVLKALSLYGETAAEYMREFGS